MWRIRFQQQSCKNQSSKMMSNRIIQTSFPFSVFTFPFVNSVPSVCDNNNSVQSV